MCLTRQCGSIWKTPSRHIAKGGGTFYFAFCSSVISLSKYALYLFVSHIYYFSTNFVSNLLFICPIFENFFWCSNLYHIVSKSVVRYIFPRFSMPSNHLWTRVRSSTHCLLIIFQTVFGFCNGGNSTHLRCITAAYCSARKRWWLKKKRGRLGTVE